MPDVKLGSGAIAAYLGSNPVSISLGSTVALPRPVDDADALAYIEAVEAADGEHLEHGVRKAIEDLVIGLKADSNWTPLGATCLLAGPRTLAGILVPLAGPAPTNNGPFVTADYNRKTGLVGNAATKYLDSNVDLDDFPQDSFHQVVYQTTADTDGATRVLTGAGGALAGSSQIQSSGSDISVRCRTAFLTTLSSANVAGLVGTSRAVVGSYTARAGQSDTAVALASDGLPVNNLFFFARDSAGPISYTAARLAFYSAGTALGSLANLETRIDAYLSAIGSAIP